MLGLISKIRKIPRYIWEKCYKKNENVILSLELKKHRAHHTGTVHIKPIRGSETDLAKVMHNHAGMRSHLKAGYDGFIGFSDGKPVGYVWYHDSGLPSESLHPALVRNKICLRQGDVYLFSLFISKSSRGETSTDFFRLVCEALESKGYTRAFGWVDSQNIPARWLYNLLGWKEINRVQGVQVGEYCWYSSGTLYLHNKVRILRRRDRPLFDYSVLISFENHE